MDKRLRALTGLFFKISFTSDNTKKCGKSLKSYAALYLTTGMISIGILKASAKFSDLFSETFYYVFAFNLLSMFLIYPDSTEIDIKHFYFTSLSPIPETILFKANLFIILIIYLSIVLIPIIISAINIYLKYKTSAAFAGSFFFICLISGLAFAFAEFSAVIRLSKKYNLAKIKILHTVVIFVTILSIYFFNEIMDIKNIKYLNLQNYKWLAVIPHAWPHSFLYLSEFDIYKFSAVILFIILVAFSFRWMIYSGDLIRFAGTRSKSVNIPLNIKILNYLHLISASKFCLLKSRQAALASIILTIKARDNSGGLNHIEHYLYFFGYIAWQAFGVPAFSPFLIISICSISALYASVWLSESIDYKSSYLIRIAPINFSDIAGTINIIILLFKFLPQYLIICMILLIAKYSLLSLFVIIPAVHFWYFLIFVFHQSRIKALPVSAPFSRNYIVIFNIVSVTAAVVYFTFFEFLYNFYNNDSLLFHFIFCAIFLILIYSINIYYKNLINKILLAQEHK